MIILSVYNDRTNMTGGDGYIHRVLDMELSYPTDTVAAIDRGIDVPTAWDGWVRFFHQPQKIPPWFPTGLLSYAIRHLEKHGYSYQVIDHRERPDPDVPETSVEIPLRDYQVEAVEAAIREGRGVLDMPPRAGKTRTMCEIQRRLHHETVWIAPTNQIVTQTQRVLSELFGPGYSAHLVGGEAWREKSGVKVWVATAATVGKWPAEAFQGRKMVVVDEFHHSAAKTYRNIFRHLDHVYHRYGMTGTFFRSGQDAMAMHSILSTAVYQITTTDLFRRGYLVPTYTVMIRVPGPHLRMTEKGRVFQTAHGKHGIHEHPVRQQMVAHAAHILWQIGRTTLILVGTKRQGRMLAGILEDLLPATPAGAEFGSVEFVSTDMDRKRQGRAIDSFLSSSSNEVKVLIGTSLLGEGVDLPGVDALVYARGERAEVSLVQNMFRVCTAIAGKKNAVVVDFVDSHHRKLLDHSRDRYVVYDREPTFSLSVLEDPRQFPGWLDQLREAGL